MQEQKLELIDIYDITYQPWWLSMWFRVTLGFIIGACAIALIYYVWKRYRPVVQLTYTQKALHNLQILERQGFTDGQLFYMRLTQVIKEYLHQRYELPLTDKTDSELIETLKKSSVVDQAVVKDVKDIFDGVMFIKFANQAAGKERMEQALVTSRALIEFCQVHKEQQS